MELDSAADIIRSATVINAALLMQEVKLGTIAPGACADLLIVDGDPLTDLRIMLDPAKNLKLVMKDGTIYKNALGSAACMRDMGTGDTVGGPYPR